jgi:DNA-binding Lrp family transcriptional regulator
MGGDDRAFKGVWICAAVWTNPDLSWIEKALIAEIDSLVRDEAPCYASNDHLAKRIGVSVSRTNDMLARLQKAGFLIRVQYDGRTTHRVVSSEYSSNPETAKRWISQRQTSTPARKVSRKRERRVSENRKSDFLFSGNLISEDQEARVPNNKNLYIKRIRKETPTLETTTTCQLKLDNENGAANEATEASTDFAGSYLNKFQRHSTRFNVFQHD